MINLEFITSNNKPKIYHRLFWNFHLGIQFQSFWCIFVKHFFEVCNLLLPCFIKYENVIQRYYNKRIEKGLGVLLVSLTNFAAALRKLKCMTNYSNKPFLVLNVVFQVSSLIQTRWCYDLGSNLVNSLAWRGWFNISSILGKWYMSLISILFLCSKILPRLCSSLALKWLVDHMMSKLVWLVLDLAVEATS